MTTSKGIKLNKIANLVITASCLMYIFLFQLNYPFSADLLLYVAAAMLCITLLSIGKINIVPQTVLLAGVVVVSFVGVVYTDMPTEGLREAILFCLFFCIFLLARANYKLVESFLKWVYFAAIAATATSLLQSVVPGWFNSFIKPFLRKDCYEQLMWSYEVDNAYAGIAAYTANAAFFAAIVFGQSFLNLYEDKDMRPIKNKTVNILLMVLSLYTVILNSKRGVFLAVVGAFILLLAAVYYKRQYLVKIIFALLLGAAAIVLMYNVSDTIAAFVDRFIKTDNFLSGRDRLYSSLWNNFLDGNIFLGEGTGSSYRLASSGAHNIYIQIIHDHGILFSWVFLAYLFYNYYKAFKNKAYISIFIQGVFLIYGMSGNPLYSNMYMLAYIFYTLYASYPEAVRKHQDPGEQPPEKGIAHP